MICGPPSDCRRRWSGKLLPPGQIASRCVWYLVALLLTASPTVLRAQLATNHTIPPLTEFAVETWRADNGLPQNTATAVMQTRRGYIWVGSYNGIAEFDGVRFKVFDAPNTAGLANSRVTSLHEDAQGDVWIGHDTGEVTHYRNGTFSPMTLPAAWARNPIKDFLTDEQNAIWAVNQRGAALCLSDGRIVTATGRMAANPFVNPRVTVAGSNHIYLLRNGVAARFNGNGFEVMDFSDPAAQPFYAGLAGARDGQLWVLGEGRLRKWDGTRWSEDFGEFPVADASITMMLETSTGRLLVGTLQSGLFVFDPATGWSAFNRAQGLPQDWVTSLLEDREHNLWVGTGGGLALLRQRKVKMLSPADQWQGRPVLSITRARDGAVWAATEGAGVYRFQEGNWKHYNLANQFVWAVLEDSQPAVWAGTWGGGLFRLQNEQFVAETNLIPITNPITALHEGPGGTLWIGTGTGLLRLKGRELQMFAASGGAAAGEVRVIEAAGPNEMWIGTQGAGLGHWHNGQMTTFQARDGLAGNFILSLYREPTGALWIGTLDQGLCRYQDGRFSNITTADGLPANIIYHIEDDQLGNLWFNSPLGLFRIKKEQLHRCANGERIPLDVLTYGLAEGLTTLAGTGGFTPSGFRAPDGQLWFSTARGIAVVSPQSAHPNPIVPPVWIEEILVDGQPVAPRATAAPSRTNTQSRNRNPAPSRAVELPPGRRQLDVTYTGLSFTSPNRVQFRYRLEGLDSQWTEAGGRRQVTYSFLPPGQYEFRVIACNSDGLWNDVGDALTIQVLPHFWQELWFKTLLALSSFAFVGLGVYAVSRRRHRQKLERIAQERALDHERARIAQDIHDDLGASLTRIGLLSESAAGDLEDPERTTANLEQILSTTRDLTRSMDEIVWAVNPRHDTLESLINYVSRFAHDFLNAAHIRCRLAMPLELPDISVRSEVRHNLFLACKEALNNVVKHARANEVRLNVEFVPGGMRFVIADNGSGFDLAHQSSDRGGRRPGAGNGLANLAQRLQQIGGRSQVQSSSGEGTRVEFFVPLADLRPHHLA